MRKYLKISITAILILSGAVYLFLDKEHNKYNSQLFAAVRNGDLKTVQELISKNANLEARDNAGQTPLHSAVYNDKYDVATLLIKSGAKLEVYDNRGGTPLHWAA